MTMAKEDKNKRQVESLCPVCFKKVNASFHNEENSVYMIKTCPEHGLFKTLLWTGSISMDAWVRNKERATIDTPLTTVEKGCPFDCGLCEDHRQHTCTALIEITKRCNLNCTFCFADASKTMDEDMSMSEIKEKYETVMRVSGKCNIQLSGGEPTVRDDLPEIIELGKQIGFPFIQLNTNGVRLASEPQYAKRLKEAGLSSIFLQFDGTTDSIYKRLRNVSIFDKKIQAIENCAQAGIGVVLVPTLVPGVNTNNIGEIIRFAISRSPAVRGVHFQPVSYFGRVPKQPDDSDRITLPEVMEAIVNQMEGEVTLESMKPPGCENALCSFHGNYIIEKGTLRPVTKHSSCGCTTEKAEEGANKAKGFVRRSWSAPVVKKVAKPSSWDAILMKIQTHAFSISGMAFQDIWNVNLERIRECCIHVVSEENKLVPFCMYNMTSKDGKTLYRIAK